MVFGPLPSWLLWTCGIWAGTLGTLFVVGYWLAHRALEGLPSLKDSANQEGTVWPRLSLIVTACNEENTIEAAANTLLSQDYPDLEIVMINDRSTDRTGELIDAAAARDGRVTPVHIKELPKGWLGKVHALHVGTQKASGEWLLFCDADIHLAPDCLQKAIRLAQEHDLDHLPVLPKMRASGFWLESTFCAFAVGYLATLRAEKLTDPESDAFAGVGAFNLVKAETFLRSEGFEWLRLEIVDDVGLGLLLKNAKGRTGLAVGEGLVHVAWYPSISAMVRGLEKNTFAAFGHYQISILLARLLLAVLISCAPLAALALPLWTGAWLLPLLAGLAVVLWARSMQKRLKARFLAALCAPFTAPILWFAILRSGWCCWRRGGVVWKDTFYSLAELAAGQRVKV